MRVKICGITRAEDAAAAIAAGADLLGFVFVPGTPRAVTASGARWIRELGGVETAGVFRDAPLSEVLETRDLLKLDWIQLHGDEPDEYLAPLGRQVLRRVGTEGGVDWERVRWLAERCLPLIDPGAGDGVACEWSELAARPPDLSLGLAGGLDPKNVGEAIRIVRPVLVDVSSGVESVPGVKDGERMRSFVEAAQGVECSSRAARRTGRVEISSE